GQWNDAAEAFDAAQRIRAASSPPLPALPELDAALRERLHELASLPALREPRTPPPILLLGLPGSGVGRIAALLGDQPALKVRRDRFAGATDFLGGTFDARLLDPLTDADLAWLERRYARPLQRADIGDARVIEWLPWFDARVLPALRRVWPNARIVIARREARDTLLNWLVFGGARGLTMPDAIEGARWLKLASDHQSLGAETMTAHTIDTDALLADPAGEQGAALTAFLGLQSLQPGALSQAASHGRKGLPIAFAPGHGAHYQESLAEAFAALD
nr:hypothetical protein [Pseudomonadota bacterium]